MGDLTAPANHVVIVGAGFSALALARRLIETPQLRVTMIGPGPVGAGLAYGRAAPWHRLNVPQPRMGDDARAVGAFADWCAAHAVAENFAPRPDYARYLADDFAALVAGSEGRLLHVDAQVVAARYGGGAELTLDRGAPVRADVAVLATGNAPPDTPAAIADAALDCAHYTPDPWADDALDGLPDDAPVLLLGTGLTMVDLALSLAMRGHRGEVIALSRRGLLPRAHAAAPEPPLDPPSPEPRALSAMLRDGRAAASGADWRRVVDAWRPVTQTAWAGADDVTRRRFLRHLRPWWDVHRHRLAPDVAAAIEAQIASGALRVAAGRLTAVSASGDGVRLRWASRGGGEERATVARIINCTGAGSEFDRGSALIDQLAKVGTITPDPLGLGIACDEESRAVDRDGASVPWLYLIGPPTRGRWWEVTAVPDIRNAAATMAARLIA